MQLTIDNYMTGYIIWNISNVMFEVGGFKVLWYGVLFAIGLTLAGWWIYREFGKRGWSDKDFEIFLVWGFVCMFLGCRLAHCLFYQFDYFSQHPIEILLPIKVMADGSWKFTGYHGLASHGGAVGMIAAIIIFYYRTKKLQTPFGKSKEGLWTMFDLIALGTCLAGGFIRLGNLMNSEIVGMPTDVPWAVIFTKIDELPRHPSQMYEAIFYFGIFAVLGHLFTHRNSHKPGFYCGITATAVFIFRFLIEAVKESKVVDICGIDVKMGQLLSIPFIIFGTAILILRWGKETTKQ